MHKRLPLFISALTMVGALWLCFGPLSNGQTLPRLTAGSTTGRVATVSWPYTNAGFALQESTNLRTSAWQPSPLSPLFNSNSAAFFVSAPATNAARFFRLVQPADLRGIYVYSDDVSQITSNAANSLAASLTVGGVDGLVLAIGWGAIETNKGAYSWIKLDEWMSLAAGLHKKVDLAILAGNSTPAWLFAPVTNGGAGAAPLNFTISPHSGQTSNCIPETLAAPWDQAFLSSWNAMLSAVSAHLKAAGTYSNLTLVRLTGINRTTDELRLPAETAASTGLSCVSNAPDIWAGDGYTPNLLLQGWSNVLNSFQTSFPDKSFSVAIIPTNAFPALDNNSKHITNNIPDANQPLLALASQRLAGRLVVQFNFLMTGQSASVAVIDATQNYGVLAAFQSNDYFGSTGGGAACGGSVTNPVLCTNATYIAELQEGIYPLGAANGLRAQYIEVFPANVNALPDTIMQAHSELFGGP